MGNRASVRQRAGSVRAKGLKPADEHENVAVEMQTCIRVEGTVGVVSMETRRKENGGFFYP